ncbi:MAG: hypothetical protein CMD74_03520 [Gammaproteobacteria bacterium]|nr:hypothetical protein [Gammaproteobacteria bacterium]
MKIAFYPTFKSKEEIADHYYRLHWYLHPYRDQCETITLIHDLGDDPIGDFPAYLDPSIKDLVGNGLEVKLWDVSAFKSVENIFDSADLVLIWDANSTEDDWISQTQFAEQIEPKICVRVDHISQRFAGSFYLKLADHFEPDASNYIKESNAVFKEIRDICSADKGYIFGTGPNLSAARAHDFSDGTCIACNSMVRNIDLLDRLQPSLIVIADPIFHAGPSRYAGTFRSELVAALDRYDCFLIVPTRDYHIYRTFLPQRFHAKISGIPYKSIEEPNLDLDADFYVSSTPNILTLFLLPLAATFFKEIYIAGCDGRPVDADGYFWAHDSASQINEEMNSIQRAHPAFFEIDYNDYYREHCETLDLWIKKAESNGKLVETITPSYIPVLRDRYKDPRSDDTSIAEIIVLDPDAIDSFGHFLSMDDRIGEAAQAKGLDFSVFGNVECGPDIVADRPFFEPVFSVHSWAIGTRPDNHKELARFSSELDRALAKRKELGITRPTLVYLYLGSLPAAQCMLEVLEQYPNVSGVVCLFWLSYIDYRNPEYVSKWGEVFRKVTDSNLELTVPTEKLAKGVMEAFRFNLAVAPHPSTTFSDDFFTELVVNDSTHTAFAKEKLNIIFPGGVSLEKGFDKTTDLAPQLASVLADDVDVTVRLSLSNNAPTASVQMADKIRVSSCIINDEHLDDESFVEWLQSGDIMVLPYSPNGFRDRTSGLLIDALYLGIPVVVWEGTWLADIVDTYKNGVIVKADGHEKFSDVISSLIAQIDHYRDLANDARNHYFTLNSWDAFISSIIQIYLRKKQDLAKEYDTLVQSLPTQAPIFLPTDRVPLGSKVSGLRQVKKLYAREYRKHYAPKLRELRESYKGTDRCFIIGNGPSLNVTDLSLLRDEVTFATNGFFLKANALGWTPTFYVVEDHLVAEDRKAEIAALRGSTKLFPIYLAYCCQQDDETIFFNHRPRVSYPEAFDFSSDASKVTYAGCTVTYTCMQLAVYMGFKEIILVGVDADYDIPSDVTTKAEYGVEILDMGSDDPNHFDPDYFGKGYRWHDPQVDKMMDAYETARRALQASNQSIVNATVGGKLEVFPRKAYESLFPSLSDSEAGTNSTPKAVALQSDQVPSRYPRVLLIDISKVGDFSATGQLKRNMFDGWTEGCLFQVYSGGNNRLFATDFTSKDIKDIYVRVALKLIQSFDPEIIFYRPVPDNMALHSLAMKIICELELPLVSWIMDDWPSLLPDDDTQTKHLLTSDLQSIFDNSKVRFSISESMSEAYMQRYRQSFVSIANGIDVDSWSQVPINKTRGETIVRYAGALADNMTLDSVVRVARSIEEVNAEFPISFEVRTDSFWAASFSDKISNLQKTSVITESFSANEYRKWMQSADIIVVAYNFDALSVEYTQYSMANKLPECLASGAAILAHGPSGIATIDYINNHDCAAFVGTPDEKSLVIEIKRLVTDLGYRNGLVEKARKLAFKKHNLVELRNIFRSYVFSTVGLDIEMSNGFQEQFPRDAHAHIDETQIVAELFSSNAEGSLMIDVGAHHGSALAPFHRMSWTVLAFEPDVNNRSYLVDRYGQEDNIVIDPRAVGEEEATDIDFFTSDESTGISGMLAFTDTHRIAGKVAVTTVEAIIEESAIKHIDFLKIDVEGHDLSVLKGVPWNQVKPSVIECEFEDKKTNLLGHSWKDICEYLQTKGYVVYVSEWHPIIRYGIQHDWLGLKPYPCELDDSDGWGNILAFRQDPGVSILTDALKKHVKFQDKKIIPAINFESLIDSPKMTMTTAFHMRVGEWLRRKSRTLFVLGQFVLWCIRFARRRPLFFGASTVGVLFMVLLPFLDPIFKPYTGELWLSAFVISLIAVLMLLTSFVIKKISDLKQHESVRYTALRNQMAKELEKYKAQFDREIEDYAIRDATLSKRLDDEGKGHRSLVATVKELHGEVRQDNLDLNERLGGLDSEVADQRLKQNELSEAILFQDDLAQRVTQQQESQTKLSVDIKQGVVRTSELSAQMEQFREGQGQLNDRLEREIIKNNELSAQIAGFSETQLELREQINREMIKNDDRMNRQVSESAEMEARLVDQAVVKATATGIHSFNRRLDSGHLSIFREDWQRKLGLNYTDRTISYLADRICLLERNCRGRLATNIEDAVLRVLVAAAVKRPNLRVIEIGTLFGIGLGMIYDHTRSRFDGVHLTGIDPLEGYYGQQPRDIITDEPIDQRTFEDNLEIARVPSEDFTLIKNLSTDDLAISEAGELAHDVLIIDGDHSYAGVKSDYVNYLHVINRGGYIVFDDYASSDWPDVTNFVDDIVMNDNRVSLVGKSWRTAVFRVIAKSETIQPSF